MTDKERKEFTERLREIERMLLKLRTDIMLAKGPR